MLATLVNTMSSELEAGGDKVPQGLSLGVTGIGEVEDEIDPLFVSPPPTPGSGVSTAKAGSTSLFTLGIGAFISLAVLVIVCGTVTCIADKMGLCSWRCCGAGDGELPAANLKVQGDCRY